MEIEKQETKNKIEGLLSQTFHSDSEYYLTSGVTNNSQTDEKTLPDKDKKQPIVKKIKKLRKKKPKQKNGKKLFTGKKGLFDIQIFILRYLKNMTKENRGKWLSEKSTTHNKTINGLIVDAVYQKYPLLEKNEKKKTWINNTMHILRRKIIKEEINLDDIEEIVNDHEVIEFAKNEDAIILKISEYLENNNLINIDKEYFDKVFHYKSKNMHHLLSFITFFVFKKNKEEIGHAHYHKFKNYIESLIRNIYVALEQNLSVQEKTTVGDLSEHTQRILDVALIWKQLKKDIKDEVQKTEKNFVTKIYVKKQELFFESLKKNYNKNLAFIDMVILKKKLKRLINYYIDKKKEPKKTPKKKPIKPENINVLCEAELKCLRAKILSPQFYNDALSLLTQNFPLRFQGTLKKAVGQYAKNTNMIINNKYRVVAEALIKKEENLQEEDSQEEINKFFSKKKIANNREENNIFIPEGEIEDEIDFKMIKNEGAEPVYILEEKLSGGDTKNFIEAMDAYIENME